LAVAVVVVVVVAMVIVVMVMAVVVFPMAARLRVFEVPAGLVLVSRDAVHARELAGLDVAAAVPAREQFRVGAVAVEDRGL